MLTEKEQYQLKLSYMNDIEELRSGLVKLDRTRSMRECINKLDECMLWLSADIENLFGEV